MMLVKVSGKSVFSGNTTPYTQLLCKGLGGGGIFYRIKRSTFSVLQLNAQINLSNA